MSEEIYSEFKEIQDNMSNSLQDLTTSLILAYEKSNNSLMLDEDVSKYLRNSKELTFTINNYFVNMVGAFNKAYSNIQKNIDTSFEGVCEMMCDQDEKLNSLCSQVGALTGFLTYKNPSEDYTTMAKFMLENIKTENGSTIKGKVINIQNLAYILMKYDEMKTLHKQQHET